MEKCSMKENLKEICSMKDHLVENREEKKENKTHCLRCLRGTCSSTKKHWESKREHWYLGEHFDPDKLKIMTDNILQLAIAEKMVKDNHDLIEDLRKNDVIFYEDCDTCFGYTTY